jgi:hypothetical protein
LYAGSTGRGSGKRSIARWDWVMIGLGFTGAFFNGHPWMFTLFFVGVTLEYLGLLDDTEKPEDDNV